MTATYSGAHVDDTRRPHLLARATLALEQTTALDPLTRLVAPVAEALVRSPWRRDLLQGRWLGHTTHPLLVAAPLGMWTGVAALDLLGGEDDRPAARTLTGLGVLLAVPSAVTGLAEWSGANQRDRRTATVHAVANTAGATLYTASWRARRRGDHARGAALAMAALAAVGVGGYLGGHLTEARKVGSHHPAFG